MADKARMETLAKAARDGRQLTTAELEELTGGPIRAARKLEVPIYYASTSMLLATGNDFTIIFSRPRPILTDNDTVNPAAAITEAVASVSLTPQTAKDLLLILQANIPAWEKEFGEIQTPFSRQVANQKKEEAAAAKKKP
jgi:hypothetical protein